MTEVCPLWFRARNKKCHLKKLSAPALWWGTALLVYTAEEISAFHALWLASMEVIGKVNTIHGQEGKEIQLGLL